MIAPYSRWPCSAMGCYWGMAVKRFAKNMGIFETEAVGSLLAAGPMGSRTGASLWARFRDSIPRKLAVGMPEVGERIGHNRFQRTVTFEKQNADFSRGREFATSHNSAR
jgi:hypothetical protein